MKPRRCGKLHGFSRWRWCQAWMVMFHRRSRWTGWRAVDVMASLYASSVQKRLTPAVKELLVKRIDPARVKKEVSMLSDLRGFEKFPRLKEFLTDPGLELDGVTELREPGTIYIVPREGVLAVTLKEPSQSLMLRLECPSLAALWPTIEAALDDTGSLWEVDPWARKRKGGKKK